MFSVTEKALYFRAIYRRVGDLIGSTSAEKTHRTKRCQLDTLEGKKVGTYSKALLKFTTYDALLALYFKLIDIST